IRLRVGVHGKLSAVNEQGCASGHEASLHLQRRSGSGNIPNVRDDAELARPDASGKGFESLESELLVKMDGCMVFSGDSERKFLEFQTAKRVRGGEHERTAETVTLVAGEDTDLRGVADARRDFAGQYSSYKVIAAGVV